MDAKEDRLPMNIPVITERGFRQMHLANIERMLEEAVAATGKDPTDCRLESVTQATGGTVYYIDGAPILTDCGLVSEGFSMKFKIIDHRGNAPRWAIINGVVHQ